jgi:Flp pilus assembly protein TadD
MSTPLAIVVLGMHRSGTSCLAGMLAAAGVAAAGETIRNWDNARGHHEMLDVVRLNEAVLAHSGGHWLAPPRQVSWTTAHAAERDRLLGARVRGSPALLKDPRTLLVLPFWRASPVPCHAIGIVRHPLAVARSLEAWRGIPLSEGVALWSAHNRALAADRARYGGPLVDFDAPRPALVAAVLAACAPLGRAVDAGRLAAAYDETLIHHDAGDAPAGTDADSAAAAGGAGDAPIAGLAAALALHRHLAGAAAPAARPPFPRAQLAEFRRRLAAGAPAAALAPARAAVTAIADPAAVLVPVVAALLRVRAHAEARALIAEHAHEARSDGGLTDLLLGKVCLAAGDPAAAARHLAAACAAPRALSQARHLLAPALRGAGRHAAARAALRSEARRALYPHRPLATLAEWSWLDGDPRAAVAHMQRAVAAAPPHRRGRLRTRLAEWWLALGDPAAARAELALAIAEDPAYARSREVLARAGTEP